MRRNHFLMGLALLAGSAAASTLELETRAQTRRSGADSLQQTVFHETAWQPWLVGRFGARLGLSTKVFDALSLMGETSVKPLPWIEAALRLTHGVRFEDGTGATTIFARFALEPELLFGVGWTASVGYYWRFDQLTRPTMIPTFTNVSFVDRDLATTFGFFYRADTWRAIARIGSWEAMDVYRLNHPYAEGVLEYAPWNAFALVRSQLLLGFGRLDGWIVGAGVRWELGEAT